MEIRLHTHTQTHEEGEFGYLSGNLHITEYISNVIVIILHGLRAATAILIFPTVCMLIIQSPK